MAASMKGLSPELRKYLRVNKLPDIYEALITGLAIMCPADPLQFILDKLQFLKENGLDILQWDIFIDESMRPLQRVITESNLDFIFNYEEWLMPSPEMYAAAYGHYNLKLKEMCFCSWMQYFLVCKRKTETLNKKLSMASMHHTHRMLRVHIQAWKAWMKYRKGRQAMSYQKIQHVFYVCVGRIVFEAWHKHTLEARRQREYFEKWQRLERGENMEDEDLFGQGTGEARDSISLLPKKIAIQVFSYVDIADLANCACVCRSWKVITQSGALWSRMNFFEVQKRLKDGVTDKVAARLLYKARPYLIHLNLRECQHLKQATFVSVSQCRNIQDLNLSGCLGLDDDTLKLITKGCKILLYLNISHTSLTDASLRAVAKYCVNLQYISLAFCNKFSDRGLHYLSNGKCSKKLEYLDLSGCLQVTPQGFQNLASGCINLTTLILDDFPTLMDDSIIMMTEKCHKIHTVSFLGSPLLTDESFKHLAQLKQLRVLKVDGNHRISDDSMRMVGKLCPDLQHIYLTDCQRLTDSTLKSFANCRSLTVLNIADCVRISDAGVRHLTEGVCTAKLRELNLTNCVRVGDLAMVNLHKRCHSLTYLCVNYCEHISEAGIELLGLTHSLVSLDITGCNCGDQGLSALGNNSRLRDVCLSECTNITDLGLQKFAQQCSDIQRLDLSHCKQLTDGAIKNLAFCCRMLMVLNLAGCKLVTDLGIQYLSGVCHHLMQLDVSGCILISDKALKYLRKGCKKLRSLTMLYCKGISKHAAQKISRHIQTVDYNYDDVPAFYGY
ncbi:dynein regulatory complex subunit 6-like isoform X5 [Pomacea canaliculata]|uniref:dynein regulatory complex subunit 6-like isoform X5 n=1 Tax=Pomacea canaliculata TaxID=400727 RepID=UPI000D73C155|nr:dynein regulatory complex subunit 6-like isoform X5 [Pomacea canaliculata]